MKPSNSGYKYGRTSRDTNKHKGHNIIYDDAVLYLKFDEGQGTFLFDSSDYKNHGTATGMTWGLGRNKRTGSFDGTDDDVTVSSSSNLTFTSDNFTTSFWFRKGTNTGTQAIFDIASFEASGWELWFQNSILNFRTHQSSASQDTTSTTINASTWYHVVLVRDGATATFYFDGVDASDSQGTHIDPVTNSLDLKIGTNQADGNDLQAEIGSIAIHSRALTIAEIQDLYEGEL